MRYLSAITMLILALAITQPVEAQGFKPDFNVGYAAYVKRDNATALKHFRLLAKQGNAEAQYSLCAMYRDGYGVVQDLVMAYVWCNVSSALGRNGPGMLRDETHKKLNVPERKLALKLSKLCLKKPARCPEYSDD